MPSCASTMSPKAKTPIRFSGVSTRSKTKTPSIDLQAHAYNRTDPFHAFNVLLKLLSSLPSRIGGCQYKLTPEEHKLSLHLLNIVEPFVGLAPSKRTTITRQPTEILDTIVFHIDEPKDLLSLALSCRRLRDVVIPRHLDYRFIRCKLSSIRVWNHLIVHRSLARNVRRLEILDERSAKPEIIPSNILTSDTDLESTDDELGLHAKYERYLLSALGKMAALKSVLWSCNHSPITIEHLWSTLLKCKTLTTVEINDNMVFNGSRQPDDESENRKPRNRRAILPMVQDAVFRSTNNAYGAPKHPSAVQITDMLTSCPNVKSLEVSYNQPRGTNPPAAHLSIDDLLSFGRWPHLTRLYLTGARYADAGGDAATSFLSAHINLEVLHLELGNASTLCLPPNSLPKLREIKAHRNIVTSILACENDLPRPLETIKGVRLSSAASDQSFLAAMSLPQGSQVKRIELAGWSDMDDIRRLGDTAPNLTWLDVGGKAGSTPVAPTRVREARSTAAMLPVSNPGEWAAVLAAFPRLAVFSGVRFFYEVSPHAIAATAAGSSVSMTDRSRLRKNDEVAAILAWKCPKLRRLDHWEADSGKVVVLSRDAEKEKASWEVRRLAHSA
ncbi:hypothetical protein HGRIS_000023 [Hohenbuehelia grisea]|uniref:F-box domain-containing protein n=1 Tax=Hohenbuehelia grisea TaxID=104357 RepID=A0ABR3JRS6_9AGAR